jgi:hypothetical protein
MFDSEASHGFLILSCVQKVGLTLCAIQVHYSISTPGGRVIANQTTHKIPLELTRRVFPTTPVILGDTMICSWS